MPEPTPPDCPPPGAAADHRLVAAHFTELVRGADPARWDDPAPCAGWVARDVVRHLVEWFPAFLEAGTGIVLAAGPSVDEDPAAAWSVHAEAVQAVLDDPATSALVLSNPHIGEMSVSDAVAMVYTPDVFLHSWDLARATGQDERLDPVRCAGMLAGMLRFDEALRGSGHYGPRVEVADDADPQTQLLAFIGRRV